MAPIQALFCTQIQVAQQTSQEIAAALGSPPEQLLVVFIIQELVYKKLCVIWTSYLDIDMQNVFFF